MERKEIPRLHKEIDIKEYEDGAMAIVFPKEVRDKFDEVFKDKRVDVFVALGKRDQRMIIKITVAKDGYIA